MTPQIFKKKRKECLAMRHTFTGKAKRWFVVGGLLLLMGITSVGHVQAAALLSGADIDSLTYMREEEKLARDVYLYLHDKWGSRIFDNISASEQTHMDAIKTLLDKYGLDDPAAENDLGVFKNSKLQVLYTELIEGGSGSLIAALKVGVFIEITDISDLTVGIAETERRDIERVYTNLRKGSQNHWDAFCSNLVKLGEACEPYELPQP
jgi:hypothetical protein